MLVFLNPEFFKFSQKNENFVNLLVERQQSPLIPVAAALWFWKILGKLENFGMFFFKFGKFWKLRRTLENYVILFPKKEANYDAGRGIYLQNLDQTSLSKS